MCNSKYKYIEKYERYVVLIDVSCKAGVYYLLYFLFVVVDSINYCFKTSSISILHNLKYIYFFLYYILKIFYFEMYSSTYF